MQGYKYISCANILQLLIGLMQCYNIAHNFRFSLIKLKRFAQLKFSIKIANMFKHVYNNNNNNKIIIRMFTISNNL